MRINDKILLTDDEIGDDHISTSDFTPIRDDAFDKSDEEKISIIQEHVKEIMLTLGLDLTDDSLRGTPKRIAKSYVKELFYGLNPKNKPKAATFDNKYNYSEMLVEKDITLYSTCEHHFYRLLVKHILHTSLVET